MLKIKNIYILKYSMTLVCKSSSTAHLNSRDSYQHCSHMGSIRHLMDFEVWLIKDNLIFNNVEHLRSSMQLHRVM